jgi:hypothetical protein
MIEQKKLNYIKLLRVLCKLALLKSEIRISKPETNSKHEFSNE